MKSIAIAIIVGALGHTGLAGCASSGSSSVSSTQIGTVERVWEDGFSLNTGSRTLRVDSYDVFGDNTRQSVTQGSRVRVTGVFSGREFDASAVAPAP